MPTNKHSVNDEATEGNCFLTAFTPKSQQGLCHWSHCTSPVKQLKVVAISLKMNSNYHLDCANHIIKRILCQVFRERSRVQNDNQVTEQMRMMFAEYLLE